MKAPTIVSVIEGNDMPETLDLTEIDIDLEALYNEDIDDSKTKHFFLKTLLELNALTGEPIEALCGFISKGKVDLGAGHDMCPKCVFIFENVVGTNRPDGGR